MEREHAAKSTANMTRRRGKRGRAGPLARLNKSPATLKATASLVVTYLKLVKATTRFVYEPGPMAEVAEGHAPFIAVGWHGQMLLMPVLDLAGHSFDILVSHHSDGDLMAGVVSRFGYGTVRGSGSANPAKMHQKGGVSAFRSLKRSLDDGRCVVATADFNRSRPRQVSRGIVTLARVSGRPVFPVAVNTSRRYSVGSWDRTNLNLPFSRGAFVVGGPVYVPPSADEEESERIRADLEARIEAANLRARQIVDGDLG